MSPPFDPLDVQLGRVIRARRRQLGASQAAVAMRIGVTFQQVQKYESGGNRIAVATLFRIAQALDTSASALLDDLPTDEASSAAWSVELDASPQSKTPPR